MRFGSRLCACASPRDTRMAGGAAIGGVGGAVVAGPVGVVVGAAGAGALVADQTRPHHARLIAITARRCGHRVCHYGDAGRGGDAPPLTLPRDGASRARASFDRAQSPRP